MQEGHDVAALVGEDLHPQELVLERDGAIARLGVVVEPGTEVMAAHGWGPRCRLVRSRVHGLGRPASSR